MKKTILLVDDDPCMLELIGSILELEGHQVIRASNVEMAVKAVNEKTIDWAFLDVRMPRVDGTELANLISWMKPDVKIAFLTGVSDTPRQGVPVLYKPFTIDALLTFVRSLL